MKLSIEKNRIVFDFYVVDFFIDNTTVKAYVLLPVSLGEKEMKYGTTNGQRSPCQYL